MFEFDWIILLICDRENEFTNPVEASVFCGTWNVNAKKQEGGLEDWLRPPNQPMADIYAVGFQEIVDLNALNVALNSNNTIQRSQFWQDSISECLSGSGTSYALVSLKHLVGLLLCVYVKESLVNQVKDIRASSAGVGLMGMMGNKGGVAIRFNLYDSAVCFVCSHLAAHRENVTGRNNDFKNIMERVVFASELSKDEEFDGGSVGVVMPKSGAAQFAASDMSIADHEIIFWLGDLNYRIDDEFSTEDVFAKLESGDLESLRQKDQLNLERVKGNVFQGFEEGLLTFPPTYKYQPGTDVYETRAEKKLRAPAWCDRVLWKTSRSNMVSQVNYRRAALNPSDHKPVGSYFNCRLQKVVESKERVVFQELMNVLASYSSTSNVIPVLETSSLNIHIDKVYYEVCRIKITFVVVIMFYTQQKYESVITLKNVGPSIAHWHFVTKVEENRLSKRWLSFDTPSGLLLPGESFDIGVSVVVDKRTAHLLNAGKDTLDDLVVLRLEKSNDFYVSVTASYVRSCYGMFLEELVNILEPVSTTLLPIDGPGTDDGSNGEKLSVPKELWRLVDALWSGSALREKDLFALGGDAGEIVAIRTSLDTGAEFLSSSPHSFAMALLTFIGSFARPVLPLDVYPTVGVNLFLRFVLRTK